MRKNIIAMSFHVLLIFTLILTIGVLINSDDEQSEVNKFDGILEENAVLRILENDTAKEAGYLQELLDAFNEEYAEFGIVAVDANMDQYLDLEQDGPYGYGPDILYQANDSLMKYTDGQHIQPIPIEELQCYEYLVEGSLDAYQQEYDEVLYTFGVPVNIQGPLLYYRKDMLPTDWEINWDDDKNGVPDMVEYWTDMYRYSQYVREDSDGELYGYMKSLSDSYFGLGYMLSYGGYIFGDNGTNTSDIGISASDAVLGAQIIRQLASIMNEDTIDDTITVNAYSMLANGSYFSTMTTPDVYSLFIKELTLEYQSQGYSTTIATEMAYENLVMTDIPALPISGDLEDESLGFMSATMMGGINGYAISSYTKYPNAALAFIDFATSYEMIELRSELVGISPARLDVSLQVGGISSIITDNLEQGNIYVMPSVRSIAQVWTPVETFLSDLSKDPFRKADEQKYLTKGQILAGLIIVDTQIYDAIHTLS